ncbi:NitT/TauT family transport system permease protein [Microvirga subterranea]|uniref:NitT/TauT family transport system permease protein n=1 Tax=Microvirga subterranea TaxID=186651 RepID=A0A370H2M7_9HYPH|nr:NitT/TauT family transport system permease protein [Microvirga subterranea]
MTITNILTALRSLAIAIAVWWIIVLVASVPAYLLPAPDAVAARFVFLTQTAELMKHIRVTLTEIGAGFVLGGLLGVAFGWLFVRIPLLGRLLSPLILLLQTAPKIAIAPLLLLWLGLDMGPKITLIAIVTFFPVMAGAAAGFAAVEKPYRDLATLLHLGTWKRFRRIELPFSLPPILAGLRIASTQAVTAAVIGELMGATYGLGYLLSLGQENGDASVVIVAVLILSAIGWGFHEVIRLCERRMLSWHTSQVTLDASV